MPASRPPAQPNGFATIGGGPRRRIAVTERTCVRPRDSRQGSSARGRGPLVKYAQRTWVIRVDRIPNASRHESQESMKFELTLIPSLGVCQSRPAPAT